MKLREIEEGHPFSVSLDSSDEKTASGIEHRVLLDNGNTESLIDYLIPLAKKHHISDVALKRRIQQIKDLKILDLQIPDTLSPYPRNSTTQKGNFAEIFLAEYLEMTTNANMPVYRLRFNTNVSQSMKGDDVLLFDLDATPQRIIVGEAKFRKRPDAQAVLEMVSGLVRSSSTQLPASLMFVADQLYAEKRVDLGKKVLDCVKLIAKDEIKIDYVGLLMSNKNGKTHVNRNTENRIHNLLVISLGMEDPETIVKDTFSRLEEGL